ncbi:MAG: hypothetical protein AAGC60_02685 [Acidobacteriota bacterium]
MKLWTATAACAGVALVMLTAGCSGSGGTKTAAPTNRIPDAERPFFLDPLTAYPLTLDDDTRSTLRAAHGELASATDLTPVEQEAERLLAAQPGLHPATVLAAQVTALRGLLPAAAAELRPVVDELPDYLAAALLLARLEERLERIPEAYGLYRRLAAFDRRSASRAEELAASAEEEVIARLDEALARERVDLARLELERLELWSPGARETLEAARRVAVAADDAPAELEVLRRLIAFEPDLETRGRLADLELDVGDLRAGLDLLKALTEEAPDNAELADSLQRARFLWRMELLPERVRDLARAPEIDRAGLASLLHWLVPTVRVWAVDDPPIATDIVERDDRAEIVRVLDLELLQVDDRVHRFYPERAATRAEALDALLVLIGGAEPPAACLASGVPTRRGHRWICSTAVACGLLESDDDCLPTLPLSGAEAVDLVRRGMDRAAP